MANKGHKGQIKGQTVLKLNFHIFLHVWIHLNVAGQILPQFQNSKLKKAKKAATVSQT